MAMRDVIKKAIEEGGATKESLLELTGTTEKGLASQMTYLRMMGTCPKRQEDGTYKIVSTEEWEASRGSSSGKSGKVLTPEERVEKAEKRSKRAATAFDNAKERHEKDLDNRLNELKFIKANAELEIAEIELGIAEAAKREADVEAEVAAENAAELDDDDGDDGDDGNDREDELE